MCDLETSNFTLVLSLATVPQKESNINFTYKHWN